MKGIAMTNYDALRAALLSDRQPAIVGDQFMGSTRQLLACVAALRVRDVAEPIHGGEDAPDEAIVTWTGGTCTLGEAARLSPSWVTSFAERMSHQIASDIPRYQAALRDHDRGAGVEVQTMLLCCGKWVLPIATEEAIAREIERAKAASFKPSGSLRPPKERLEKFRIAGPYISEFLNPWTQGSLGPVQAFETGEMVTFSTREAVFPWSFLSHLGNYDMMRFNIGLSDAIYRGLRAIDRARDWDEVERSLNLQL